MYPERPVSYLWSDVLDLPTGAGKKAALDEEWQTLGHVRRVMLLHELTMLPYRRQDEGWTFIEATGVVRALSKDSRKALDETVMDAVGCGLLKVTQARTAEAEEEVDQSAPETTLVVKGACKAAAGLVTPFDLL